MPIDHLQAAELIIDHSAQATAKLNKFMSQMFLTRGGRIGSGMGAIIEASWGFFLNQVLYEIPKCNIELAWMYGHGYNDFACVKRDEDWDPVTGKGEILRVENKSMVASADESKAHFDRLKKELTKTDLLIVFIWDWVPLPSSGGSTTRVYPRVLDQFVGLASEIAKLRDALHIAREGSFVELKKCPDKCATNPCVHVGEPLNASKKRERLSGPDSARVSPSVSYAANFGGLVRMLKCNSDKARSAFREICKENDVAWSYVSFVHRNFPSEEENQYSIEEWRKLGTALGIKELPKDKKQLLEIIRSSEKRYREILRKQFK